MVRLNCFIVIIAFVFMSVPPTAHTFAHEPSYPQTHTVFEAAHLEYEEDFEDGDRRAGYAMYYSGITAENSVALPEQPEDQANARTITAIVKVEPILKQNNKGALRPGDPWTRLGSLSVVLPADETNTDFDHDGKPDDVREVEIMRFITGFGGAQTFTQDVSALAPLLSDESTFRVNISTFLSPGWRASVKIQYGTQPPGYRRPVFAEPLFHVREVTEQNNAVRATVTIPEGLDQPRLRLISTGHATDGTDGDEFITRTHDLRVDGVLVARFRPWDETQADRTNNPTSGRIEIENRGLWSSDLDRSGWRPGAIVAPRHIPLPELTPGEHVIELTINGIRPEGPEGEHGYWRSSAIMLADEPWPEE